MTPLLTDTDVAAILQISVPDVQELARNGQIDGLKVGRRWRFQESAVEAFIVKSAARNDGPAMVPSVAGLHPKSAARIRRRSVA